MSARHPHPHAPDRGATHRDPQRAAERGTALAEFALVMPMLIILVLAIVDFGHLIGTRLIVTNVAREGGSIASRQVAIDANMPSLLAASGSPLKLDGADGRIVVTRIAAGESVDLPSPTITTRLTTGSLGVAARIDDDNPNMGLSGALHDHLVFDPDQGAPDIAEITVVEVFYKYRPITPLSNFIPGLLLADGGGVIITSKAVF